MYTLFKYCTYISCGLYFEYVEGVNKLFLNQFGISGLPETLTPKDELYGAVSFLKTGALSRNFLSRLNKKGTETQDRQAGRQARWVDGTGRHRNTGTKQNRRTDKERGEDKGLK